MEQVKALRLSDVEFPNVNSLCLRRRHRFIYGLAHPYTPQSTLFKLDVTTGEAVGFFSADDGQMPSEPIFVPHVASGRGAEGDEEDGVVLSVVVDGEARAQAASYLIVLDARSFRELGRVHAPCVVNFGLHNYWFPHCDDESATGERLLCRI